MVVFQRGGPPNGELVNDFRGRYPRAQDAPSPRDRAVECLVSRYLDAGVASCHYLSVPANGRQLEVLILHGNLRTCIRDWIQLLKRLCDAFVTPSGELQVSHPSDR
jgi:hypothetical protein